MISVFEKKKYDGSKIVLAISIYESRFSDKWDIDFACIFYMCHTMELFIISNSINDSSVLMGNNLAYKIIGISKLKTRMQDKIIRTLMDVRCIPNLEKNLIFLGTLDSFGYKYFSEGEVIRICKGSLVVIQGNKIDDIYLLLSSMVTSLTVVSFFK